MKKILRNFFSLYLSEIIRIMAGDLFITSLMIFFFILVLGYIIQIALWGRDTGPFITIVNILAFVGVFLHEVSHVILCVFSGMPVNHFSVRLRGEESGRVNPHGAVGVRRPNQKTFLQAVLAGLGPVLVGAWIVYFSLQVALNSLIDPLIRIFAGRVGLSPDVCGWFVDDFNSYINNYGYCITERDEKSFLDDLAFFNITGDRTVDGAIILGAGLLIVFILFTRLGGLYGEIEYAKK